MNIVLDMANKYYKVSWYIRREALVKAKTKERAIDKVIASERIPNNTHFNIEKYKDE